MSLTSQLEDRNGKVRAFFEGRFPNTRKVTGEANTLLRQAETIRPASPVPYTVSGAAFDYRMRYYFAVTPSENLAAWRGALRVSDAEIWVSAGDNAWAGLSAPPGGPSLPKETIEAFFRGLDETLSRIQPVGRKLNPDEEELLLRYCVVLAYFEECSRARPNPDSPIFSLGGQPTAEDLLNLPKPHWLDDLGALTEGMVNQFGCGAYGRIALNPTFSGSADVGGADADLILDDCLVEIKTTVKATIQKLHLYQLLGYVLLDYADEYTLEKFGFYMARQGRLFNWPINELLERLTPDEAPTLQELRLEFKELLASSKSASSAV